jgi:hypothetical protein
VPEDAFALDMAANAKGATAKAPTGLDKVRRLSSLLVVELFARDPWAT